LLIEDWLPIEELGIECRREGSVGLHPPPNRLHVWWARRPLTVSRAAVLASLLPYDFPHSDFMKLMGILGNPVEGRKKIDEVISGKRVERVKDPYGYPRAFTYTPNMEQIAKLRSLLKGVWGSDEVTVLDSFAGGGSIPFEATRLGLTVVSNELNPVASIVERSTIEFPAKFGSAMAKEIGNWGRMVESKITSELLKCFPRKPGEEDLCYIWVRTIQCPECNLSVPLSPNWWLDKKGKLGYRPIVPARGSDDCSFRIMDAKVPEFEPDKGSVSGGKAQCPRCHTPVGGEYIKEQAQNGRMGHKLAVIGYKSRVQNGRHFREITDSDLDGLRQAGELLKEKLSAWEAEGLVPNEEIPEGAKTSEPRRSGIRKWSDFFSHRQLLVHLVTLEAIRNLRIEAELDADRAKAVRTYLALALDKAISYNSLGSRWDGILFKITNLFERHDFAFRWSYGEIDGGGQLWRWALGAVVDAYENLVKLLIGTRGNPNGVYLCGDSASLPSIPTGSIPCIVIDPPYSDNVMYAELSDFFYVWMKRSIGNTYPEFFSTMLTDKDREAVANKARFREFKGNQRELAQDDYEAKMKAAFKEIRRILVEDGVLTVMFTHKSDDAWDALGRGLIDAGFEITASWPVHTESEHSLHQARKVAAGSTILLVCRKRNITPGTRGWWEDIRPLVKDVAYAKAELHFKQGIRGVDLMLSTYGPALKELSSRWPVMDRSGVEIRPREALEEASRAASDFRMNMLTERMNLTMDMPTRFYIHAWDYYQAEEIPADDAIKLSHTLSIDLNDLEGRYDLVKKKGNFVIMQDASARAKSGALDIGEDAVYHIALDKVHATELAYNERGVAGVKRIYQDKGFLADPVYTATIDALLNSLPSTSDEYETVKNIAQYAMQSKVKDRRSDRSTSHVGLDQF